MFPEVINPATFLNKIKSEVLGTVRKRKEMVAAEVAKDGTVVDLWLRDKVNNGTWEKNSVNFPEGKKCMSQHKWMKLPDDTTSPNPIRYQQNTSSFDTETVCPFTIPFPVVLRNFEKKIHFF